MKFKDVTKQRPDIVNNIVINFGEDKAQVFERGSTRVIFSSNQQTDHVSISNPYREINEKEIDFIINLLNTRPENISMSPGNLGVLHFYHHKNKLTVH